MRIIGENMKKTVLSILMALFMLVSVSACAQTDFATEYAALNGRITGDGLHMHAQVQLPEDNPFRNADFKDVIAVLEGGTGVIYLGFPECPWCRCLVPALQDAHFRSGAQDNILCFNAQEMRDVCSLSEDGSIIVEKEASAEYKQLVDLLYDHLKPYEGLNDPSIRRIYFPTTVFVREGEIMAVHLATLDEQQDPYVPMNEALYEELVGQLLAKYQSIL